MPLFDCFLCSLFLKKTILQKKEDALVIQTPTAADQADMDSRGDRLTGLTETGARLLKNF